MHSFMQNKANFGNDKMDINTIVTMCYVNFRHWLRRKNKANSNPIKAKTNPIQSQFPKGQKLMKSLYLQRIMKNMRLWAKKNKAKTNPIAKSMAALYSNFRLHNDSLRTSL